MKTRLKRILCKYWLPFSCFKLLSLAWYLPSGIPELKFIIAIFAVLLFIGWGDGCVESCKECDEKYK